MKTSDLIQVLTAFDNWVNDHKDLVVYTEAGDSGHHPVTLKQGYTIHDVCSLVDVENDKDYPLEIIIKVPPVNEKYSHRVRFDYYPKHQKLVMTQGYIAEKWFEWDFTEYI